MASKLHTLHSVGEYYDCLSHDRHVDTTTTTTTTNNNNNNNNYMYDIYLQQNSCNTLHSGNTICLRHIVVNTLLKFENE